MDEEELEQLIKAMGGLFKAIKRITPDVAEFCAAMRGELASRGFSQDDALTILMAQLKSMNQSK